MRPAALLLSTLTLFSYYTRAQVHTNATCSSEFDWMNNSKGQSPCLITAWLWSPCFFPESFVPALAPGGLYGGPISTSESNLCECNTVAFATIAACGICQGRGDGVIPWSAYDRFCTDTAAVSKYPFNVPSGTEIPAWAFQDVTENNALDVDAAKAVAESGTCGSGKYYHHHTSSSVFLFGVPSIRFRAADESTSAVFGRNSRLSDH
ncbi:uncharacterized protein BXZ73DRAFT_102277 [Epithele typhae]|uniref:uncharacterized protein n=1 Tax=Epithele typhae TaxID=378194 RepID=UPI002007E232|nr:uncharacterized protein BXZ73DRAFT_102277 [Epithele typhae]KAH9928436.1 hypothetical protein BXZ73DRAFT_102277 [Epithele typhae]